MTMLQVKDICRDRKIRRVALVDDVFDPPSPEGINPVRYTEFRDRYNGDENLQRAVTWVTGRPFQHLPANPDDLGEEQVDMLWRSIWRPRVGGRRIRPEYSSSISDLFRGHSHNPLAMLEEVAALYSLFRHTLETTVTVFGTGYDPKELAKAHIVVIDFFLGQDLTVAEALALASEVAKRTAQYVDHRRNTAPSFLLISSRPDEIDISKFRESSQLMKSRFRFFSKQALRVPSSESTLNLHDLVAASDRTAIIEKLLDDWCDGAKDAIQEVRDTFLSLDVSDLTYLDCFRLAHEGTSIANYLKWFLTSLLSSNVSAQLTSRIWEQAHVTRFSDVFDEEGSLDENSLMGTFDGPTDAIAHAYGQIIFDAEALSANGSSTNGHKYGDLMEGDLFVRPKGRRRNLVENASVLLVLTPGCDLLVRSGQSSPSADAVIFLPGTLTLMHTEDKHCNFANGCFVRLLQDGKWQLLRVDWDFRRPTFLDWEEVATRGPGIGFRRLGRIREMYFHKVKDEFLGNLAGIGTEVAPLFPHALAGEAHIAVQADGKKQFKRVMEFSRDEGYLWQIGPVKTSLRANRSDHIYQVSRQFVRCLIDTLGEIQQQSDPDATAAAGDATERLDNLETYLALVRPMRAGRRGKANCIEIKKPTSRNTVNPSSQASILLVTFQD